MAILGFGFAVLTFLVKAPMGYLQTFIRYKLWANALIFDSIKEVSNEELIAPRPIVFGSMIRTINHTFSMDVAWQANLQSKPHGFTTRTPKITPSLEHLILKQTELDQWYVSYVDTLSEAAENEVVNFEFIGGDLGSLTRRDILLHVVNHGTYHRGNLTAMMYDCSVMPPATDYPVFLRETAIHQG